jgi:hypothetical protein
MTRAIISHKKLQMLALQFMHVTIYSLLTKPRDAQMEELTLRHCLYALLRDSDQVPTSKNLIQYTSYNIVCPDIEMFRSLINPLEFFITEPCYDRFDFTVKQPSGC